MVVYTTDAEGHKVLGGTQTMIASAVCSVLAVVVYMICYHLTTERVKMQSAEGQKNVFELFKVLFTNRAFVGIVISALIFLLVQMTLSGMNNYIYPELLQQRGGNLRQQPSGMCCGTGSLHICDQAFG